MGIKLTEFTPVTGTIGIKVTQFIPVTVHSEYKFALFTGYNE